MGDSYQTIADVEVAEREAAALAVSTVAWLAATGVIAPSPTACVFGGAGHAPGQRYTDAVSDEHPALLETRPNGLEVVTGRTVFNPIGADRVACPRCHTAAAWDGVEDAIDEWHAGGDGRRACPVCGHTVALNDWDWEPRWAFGCLGLTFWNWPPLRPDFVAGVAGRFGHRAVLVAGKL
jgi:hypothetical protein